MQGVSSPFWQPLVWPILLLIVFIACRLISVCVGGSSRSARQSPDYDHETKVNRLADKIKGFHRHKSPFRIYHGSTSSTRPVQFRRDGVVDITNLSRVLHVDREAQTILTEPNVSIRDLVLVALSKGLLPKVVMEFPDVTIGGAFSGASGNSSCFRHGLFEQTIEWIEIVLADGEIVSASPQERSDLFYGAAGTFGTLGVVTALRVQCVLAKSFVQLDYHVCHSRCSILELIESQLQKPDVDYVDGMIFAQDLGVVMSGRLIDKNETVAPISTFSGRWDPWFCLHAETIAAAGQPVTLFIPIFDYLFRYDRGAFWGGQTALKYFGLPDLGWVRWLLNSYLSAGPLTHIIHTAKLAKRFVVQDLAVPMENAMDLLDYIDRKLGWYPIWLCPVTDLYHGKVATFTSSAASKTVTAPEKLIDVGIYGLELTDDEFSLSVNRGLELELRRLGGQKALFAVSCYTSKEFWSIYDRQWYDGLREKYNASYLPTVHEKIQASVIDTSGTAPSRGENPVATWFWKSKPLPGLLGLAKFLSGSDYLFASD